MVEAYILSLDSPQATLERAGGKGASLARLAQAGLPVPGGFHITTAAYRQFVGANDLQPHILVTLESADAAQPATLEAASRAIASLFGRAVMPPDMAAAITQAYTALDPAANLPVAVRSSATAEDLPDLSFAGQQETFLNLRGAGAVLDAVKKCWASLWTARAIGYRLQHHVDQNAVALAVVVQALVPADAAGVLFTAHPVTGQRDQAMLTATWGLGEAIVGGLVTPDTLTLDKATGRVLSRETTDKQVMTVRREGGTQEQPVPKSQRRAPVLSDLLAAELVRLGVQIEQHYGLPMDIEWALAGGRLAILQARPITALPEPELPPPAEWKLSKGQYAAVRNNIVELMPDPLTPLFGSWGRAIINTCLGRWLALYVHQADLIPSGFVTTVNGYAYNNGSVRMGKLLPLVFDSPGILKRMFTGAVERWTEAGRPRYVATVERWQAAAWRDLPASALLSAAHDIFEAAIEAYSALISGVIPAAWITEALFTKVYNTLLKRRGDPPAATYLLGFDSEPIQAEKSLYDLAGWARPRTSLAAYLAATPAPQLAAQLRLDAAPPDVDPADWREWQQQFRVHLQQYGHAFYNLDFANPVAADDPAPLLETCKLFLRGEGTNPYARQQAAAQQREQAAQALEGRLKGWRLKLFRRFYAPAQRYAPLREDGLAEVGLGYPLLRQMFRELGRRLVEGGMLEQGDDVFWLEQAEVEQAAARLDDYQALQSAALIPQRKALWRAARRVTPPLMLPQMKLFGADLMDIRTGRARKMAAKVIKGVAAGGGRVTAPARVLHGPEDFSQMQPGEVLVAAITTPAWTPLFARASAVVTDIGGPLSHGSIVAREYGIPAVLGTKVATARIQSGQMITVDGTAGTVTLSAKPGAPRLDEWRLPNPKGRYMRGGLVDFMPDPLSPLFATLGIPAVVAGIMRVMRVLTRSEPVLPADYFTTINGYAYLGFGYTAREWWWLFSHLMTTSLPRTLRVGLHLWRKDVRPRYAETVSRWQARPLAELPPAELLRGVKEIMDLAAEYMGALMVGTLGASAGAEGAFTGVYDKLLKKAGDPPAPAYLMGYNSLPIQAEKSLYDLAQWLRPQAALAAFAQQTPLREWGAVDQFPDGVTAGDWAAWRDRWEAHVRCYGHIIYDLDFAKPLPADDPAPQWEVCQLYLRGEGSNPHERQQGLETRREQATQTMRRRLKGLGRWVFDKALSIGQSMAMVREDAIADMGLGYPQLRAMLLELGRRLVSAGALDHAADIFWLSKADLEAATQALEAKAPLASLASVVQANQAAHEAARRRTPPSTLPPTKRIIGINISAFLPAEQQAGDTLKGVAASAGRVTAPARVVHSPDEFTQMRPGEVLVAAITTPAWTPLFAMASAVVTDVGGPLSHGSIVAREYNIPAVMGTGVATRRIQSGQVITVDGSAGTVKLA